jgi:glycosyltransferase involved in cell wall biosynthesis
MNDMSIDPKLSIVVVGYNMPGQLRKTLHTLSADYQKGVSPTQYEVVIVENKSDYPLTQDVIDSLPDNFRYFLRNESSCSPAAAINFGIDRAKGSLLGLMVDGAHMLSPRVLYFALMASQLSEDSFVTVPAYHLGPQEQHLSSATGYDEETESELLESSNWQEDGYQLFTISSWCGANSRGYFTPIMESNCYFAPRHAFNEIGKAELRFQQSGGGSLNLHIVRKLGIRPTSLFFTLSGEGSFHQYHGGVTSNSTRSQFQNDFQKELQGYWDGDYQFLERNPIMLGAMSEQAHANLLFSSEKMLRRFNVCRKKGWPVWSDDPPAE